MKILSSTLLLSLATLSIVSSPMAIAGQKAAEYTSTKDHIQSITPNQALARLIDGNKRFLNDKTINRNLLNQKKYTAKKGQYPTALILSCMDSRGTPELTLDQGFGDIFTVRLAGNVIDSDQLGGMEYATKVVGSKLIVIMGHTNCGAVSGACSDVKLGNLTALLDKIKPAVEDIKDKHDGKISCDDAHTIDEIAKQNVLHGIKEVKEGSPIIKELLDNNTIMIVGAMHHLDTGKVDFFDENGTELK